MQKEKHYIGVWMDHSSAVLMEPQEGKFLTRKTDLHFSHNHGMKSGGKNEHTLHNKEQHKQNEFYQEIQKGLEKYDGILLFGPTHAKDEFHNLLKADHRFDHVVIDVQNTDKLTENQQHALIRKHFRLE